MAAVRAPNSLGAAVVAVAWVFGALAIFVVATRFYVRMRIVRKLFKDDYIILITLVSTAEKNWPLLHCGTGLIIRGCYGAGFRGYEQCLCDCLRFVGLGPPRRCPVISSESSDKHHQVDVHMRDLRHHVTRIRSHIICLPSPWPTPARRT